MTRPLLAIFLALATAIPSAAPYAEETAEPASAIRPIDDPESLKIIRQVEQRVGRLRAIKPDKPLTPAYLDSATLERFVRVSFDKTCPPDKRHAIEQFLKSLQAIPQDLDMIEMYLSLLDEQVAGLYDPESKRLFVRDNCDVANSALARGILAHEICHLLQDQAHDLIGMGIETSDNDDLVMAVSAVAEGDAMLLMGEYIALHEIDDILGDLSQALTMDQTALNETPHLFQQQLLFPYIQGQLLLQEAEAKGPEWRERLFTDPPRTTEQVIHSEKYFGERDTPTTPTLLLEPQPSDITFPDGLKRLEINTMGEFGLRALLETRLGAGIAHDAAAGWDGDAYTVHGDGQGKWWFCWESHWDTTRDAAQFQGAWITYWRSLTGERKLGDLTDKNQEFQAGDWRHELRRDARRVVLVWKN